MTAIATRRPTAVTLNADGKATEGYETLDVPLSAEGAKLTITVGYFPRRRPGVPGTPDLPGWYAETRIENRSRAYLCRLDRTVLRSAACRDRSHAVLDAAEGLLNRLVDAHDTARGNFRTWLKAIIDALTAWYQDFERQTDKETTAVTVTAKTKILSGKECRALLEDFRRSYEALEHSFVILGDKAAVIREQEAYGEQCATFDEWIKSEHFSRSVVYDAMKAAHFYRLTSPVAAPLKIVLDRESHFRKFPAEASAKQAKAIVEQLEKIVAPEADGSRHPTARQIEAAVAKVCPGKTDTETRGRGDPERKPPAGGTPAPAPLPALHVPETIEPEYCEVADPEPAGPDDEIAEIELHVRQVWNLHLGQAPGQIRFRANLADTLSRLAMEIVGLDKKTWHSLSQEERDELDAQSRNRLDSKMRRAK